MLVVLYLGGKNHILDYRKVNFFVIVIHPYYFTDVKFNPE